MVNAIEYALHCSRSRDAVIRVYDAAGNVIGTHEHERNFRGVLSLVMREGQPSQRMTAPSVCPKAHG
jgi:hypothetical protein